MTKLHFYLLFIIVLLSASASWAEPPIERMKANTVRVLCLQSDDSGVMGSGFIVGTGKHVVTNNHVVACSEQGGRIQVILSKEDNIDARILWKSEMKDLAVLELDRNSGHPAVEFVTSDMVRDADSVYVMGFPGAADRIVDRDSLFKVKVTKGIVSARVEVDRNKLYETDAAINSGNSGGPMFNESGFVIGINVAKISMPSVEGIGYAIEADELLPELETLGIPYKKGTAKGSPLSPISLPSDIRSSTAQGNQTNYLILSVLGGCILIAAIIFFRGTRLAQRSIEGSAQQKERNVSSASTKAVSGLKAKPYLRGLSGHFSGNDIRIGVEPITFGRDPQKCQLVFPSQFSEIGRQHCMLRYDFASHTFFLEDLNSANGTYLKNGKRLKAGLPCKLESGDGFYLVNPTSSFEVRLESRP